MANSRIVNTNFWKDSYIVELESLEMLLFIYFLTNPRTTLAGVYEITIREIAFDTRLSEQFIAETLQKFSRDGKMYYERNWLVLTNFIKHQRLNPSIIRGIEKAIEELPEWLSQKVELGKNSDNQMSLFITDSTQTGDSEGTVTPQYNIIKLNRTKLKEKKAKQQVAGDSKESVEKSKPSGAQYRKAVEADEEQQARVKKSYTRKPSPPGKLSQEEIDKAYDRRTMKR